MDTDGLAGCVGFVWVRADSFLHSVASPYHSFVATLTDSPGNNQLQTIATHGPQLQHRHAAESRHIPVRAHHSIVPNQLSISNRPSLAAASFTSKRQRLAHLHMALAGSPRTVYTHRIVNRLD